MTNEKERHTVLDERARRLNDIAERLLRLTSDVRDAEATAHIQSALESFRRFALRAGWIE